MRNSDHRPVCGIYLCYLNDSCKKSLIDHDRFSLNPNLKIYPQEFIFQNPRFFQICGKIIVFSNGSPTQIFVEEIKSTDKCIYAKPTSFIIDPYQDIHVTIHCCVKMTKWKDGKDSNSKTVNLQVKYNGGSNFDQMRFFYI